MADAPHQGTKTCPYCAEEIKAEAIRCRHCQTNLPGHAQPPARKRLLSRRGWITVTIAIVLLWAVFVVNGYNEGQDKAKRDAEDFVECIESGLPSEICDD